MVLLDFGDHVSQLTGLDGRKETMVWFLVLMAINLQTSFLTPPFGFALFYLKGVAPPEVATLSIYRGVIPFVITINRSRICYISTRNGFKVCHD